MTHLSIFTDLGSHIANNDAVKNPNKPFKNHPQIPFIIDTLSRHERHHVGLISNHSQKIHRAFIETIAQHINNESMPKTLKNCRFIYVDTAQFFTSDISEEKIIADFQALTAPLKSKNPCTILAINPIDFLTTETTSHLSQFIKKILTRAEWRLITFISHQNQLKNLNIEPLFTTTRLIEPHANDLMMLLKMYRAELENFHQVIISDEIIADAYTMAAHYLPGHSHFDKTLELLDSAAARASMLDRNSHTEQRAIVTQNFLSQVISNCTQIPLTHLHNNKFQAHKFVETLRKNVFGQDAAINVMASLLQNACIKLQDNSGPLCKFLLVGPHDVGKTEIAYAIAEHLFGRRDALLHVNLSYASYLSSTEIKIFPRLNDHADTNLLSAIQQTPYAIVLIEDIDQMQKGTFDLIKGIFDQGYIIDEKNNKYDFRHAIIIATTRTASEQISHAITPQNSQENTKSIDLMQLVLNEHVPDSTHQDSSYPSPQELCDKLIPKLAEHFPPALLQKFNIIPFVPLDYAAFEKIIRSKIKMLARRLHSSFGIELSLAPEVIKFLAHEALWRKANIKSLDKLLEQHLYSTVTHEILLRAEDRDRSKKLFIQLNDSGQLLRCEFITSNEAVLYHL